MFDTVRKSIRMLPADRRWWWAALPVLAAFTGAAEAVAAGAVFGLVKIIGDPGAVGSVPVAKLIAPHLPWQDGRGLILEFTLLVALYHVAKNTLLVGAQYARYKIVGESTAALACTMLRGYLLAPYPFHFRRHSAELIRNTTHSVHAVLTTLAAAGAILSEVLVGAGIATVLVTASPMVTLVTGVVLGTLMALLLRWTRGLAHRAGRGGHELNRELLQTLQRAVRAAVVHEDQLVRAAKALSHVGELAVQRTDVPLLVVDGHDDRQLGSTAQAKKPATLAATCSTSASVRSGWTGRERISSAARSARGRLGPSPNRSRHAGWRWIGTG